MASNKKIKNAQPLEYEGIHFKSKLEKTAFITLKEAGFPVEYESRKFILWEGFRPTVPFYDKDNASRMLKHNQTKLKDITYTPDFTFNYHDYLIVMELKGIENDRFPLKKKLFRGWLEEHEPSSMYFEIYTKRQLLQAIEIIKNLD